MRIPLDRQSPVPLYQQIEAHLRREILSGSLAPDTRLPATRELADDLGVSRITVSSLCTKVPSRKGLTRAGSMASVAADTAMPSMEARNTRQ